MSSIVSLLTQIPLDEDMIQVLLVVTHLLLESTSLTDEVRTSKLQTYYHEAIETLQGEAKCIAN